MRLLNRNTLSLAIAARSILKFTGSIKIDISKQNRSDQLFEFQTEEKIFPPWCRTNINKPPLCYHRRDLCCLDPQAFTIATPFSADNSETEIDLFIPHVFPKKVYTTEAATDDKNSLPRTLLKKQWLPVSRETQNKNARNAYWLKFTSQDIIV